VKEATQRFIWGPYSFVDGNGSTMYILKLALYFVFYVLMNCFFVVCVFLIAFAMLIVFMHENKDF